MTKIRNNSLDSKVILVSLNLVTESVIAKSESSIDHLLDKNSDLILVLFQRDHVVSIYSDLLVLREVGIIELWDLVEAGNFSESSKEVISCNSCLAVEESKPENLSVLGLKVAHDFLSQVVVHDVFEINLVKIIGPWM